MKRHAGTEVYLEVMSASKTKKKKKKRKTALVVCRDRKEFWTTQAQFWQWAREGIITKPRIIR